jgi:YebC/PmpR family DNA-binding regulatory protein
MAGHSKWNNIKNKKGAADEKRGKLFTQLSKLIKSAVKEGGSGDPQSNPGLRLIVEKARAANMPKEKIQKAIDRGLGKSNTGATLQEIKYEGFGPQGVAFIVAAVTDNPNRTSGEMKFIFSRAGGSLGGPGSVSYMFTRDQAGEYSATMPMAIEDAETQEQLQKLIDTLRENEDIEDVYCAGEWEGKS